LGSHPRAPVDVVRRNIEAVQNNGDFAVFDEISPTTSPITHRSGA
jgi:hypothetical protein